MTPLLSQHDEDLLELIAGQVAISLRNANQFEKVKEQIENQKRVEEIVDKITITNSIQEAIQVALEELASHTGTNKIAVKWID